MLRTVVCLLEKIFLDFLRIEKFRKHVKISLKLGENREILKEKNKESECKNP